MMLPFHGVSHVGDVENLPPHYTRAKARVSNHVSAANMRRDPRPRGPPPADPDEPSERGPGRGETGGVNG